MVKIPLPSDGTLADSTTKAKNSLSLKLQPNFNDGKKENKENKDEDDDDLDDDGGWLL